FARDPGAAPNFDGIQQLFDIYAEVGMLPKKLNAADFRNAKIVAPLK
ncbi:MAG TPA: ABC transporter substrate-binding protein, partial [Pseudolabrys sp.]